jgi:hypothetical protein
MFAAAWIGGTAALIVCVVYTLVIGGVVALYHLETGRVPNLASAVVMSFVGWLVPFGFLGIKAVTAATTSDLPAALFLTTTTLFAAVATGISFWALGLRGRAVRA